MSNLRSVLLVLGVLGIVNLICIQADAVINQEAKLHKDLMSDYVSTIRPVTDHDTNMVVKLSIQINGIDDMDEKTQTLSTNVWVRMTWTDVNLKWEPADYGGLTETRLSIKTLWQPDIHLFNNVDNSFEYAFEALPLIYSSGLVLWIPQITLRSRCPVDMTKFPFDTQKCELKFGSWTYPENKLNLTLFDPNYEHDSTNFFTEHGEFEIVTVKQMRNSKKYACCPESYVDITYTMEMKRRTAYSTHLVVSPGIGLLIANVFVFGEFVDMVPQSYPRVPRLGIYFVMNLALTGLSIVFTIAIIGVWNRSNMNGQVPGFLRTMFLGVFGRLCCVRRDDYMLMVPSDGGTNENPSSFENLDDQQRMMSQASKLRSSAEWRQLACILDRMFFLIFLAIVIVAAVAVQ